MKDQPVFKADLVQRSSIASAVFRRTGRRVTNKEVAQVARHLGIDAVDKGDHEYYYTKLQAMGIFDALMHKIQLESQAAPAAPAPRSAGTDEETLLAYKPAQLVEALRSQGYDVICTREIKTIESL